MGQQLSKNFTLSELTRTDHADFLDENIRTAPIGKLTLLARDLLQPIRDYWGQVTINSGYRCKALNLYIGGSPSSQHVLGEAADIVVKGYETGYNRQLVVNWLREMHTRGYVRFHQCLIEPGCIHISMPTGIQDGEVAKWEKAFVNGKWVRKKEIIIKGDS